jgi:penicillin-binding protein 1C
LLPAAAAAAVADLLTRPVPGSTDPKFAWKTGTSWGGRDAWAFGFDARHVVGVWVGRPDGTPVPDATGAGWALPILAQVFGLLPSAPRADVAAAPRATRGTGPLGADALRLLFPPPDAVLSASEPVIFRAMGGRRPLTFLVDGFAVPAAPASREAAWSPPGPGFYRLTVLDAAGAAVHAAVRVR